MRRLSIAAVLLLLGTASHLCGAEPTPGDLKERALAGMKQAAAFYREKIAYRGGYVYHTGADLSWRLGEGVAAPTEVWVQPPGTPTVGLAYLAAYSATRDQFYLEAARETGEALLYGQLKSGGWQNSIEFNPKGKRVNQYRNGKGGGKNNSTLDDGSTQTALRFLMRLDEALAFQDERVHEAAKFGLESLLAAQFPNGAFPQVWAGPAALKPVLKASYPDYDWRTDNRYKNYWELYTLNDDLCGAVTETLLAGFDVYKDQRCRDAVLRLGDFLILAQMPEPQPAWAQQYTFEMRPSWARKFEPPAICGRESQDAIETLLKAYEISGDEKYLTPLPAAIKYLKSSLLPDGRLARYYELQTNKPLYMNSKYELTHDDSDAPSHYGWKSSAKLDRLEKALSDVRSKKVKKPSKGSAAKLVPQVQRILAELDSEGRWLSEYNGEKLTGQPKLKNGDQYFSSAVFSANLETLSRFVAAEN